MGPANVPGPNPMFFVKHKRFVGTKCRKINQKSFWLTIRLSSINSLEEMGAIVRKWGS